jgi:hypothetical protein
MNQSLSEVGRWDGTVDGGVYLIREGRPVKAQL